MKKIHLSGLSLTLYLIVFLVSPVVAEREYTPVKNKEEKNSASEFKIKAPAASSASSACTFVLTPDLPLIDSSPQVETEISLAISRFSDYFLGTTPPSATALVSALSEYDNLGIQVHNGVVSGNLIKNLSELKFLRTLARHLKFNSSDTEIRDKANKAVWWASQEICDGHLNVDTRGYDYRHFGRPAILLKAFLTPQVQDLFEYTLFKTTHDFKHYWEPVYDAGHQTANGSINTDQMYTKSSILMAYSLWQDTPEERYRYMRGFKRYMERFFSYTIGTTNGIKKDGSSFHHWTAYNNYMYAFRTAIENLSYLDGTTFQVSEENYKVFRDAVLVQRLQASDASLQALSTCGRKPDNREAQTSREFIKSLAISGGKILGLDTADPVLAGLYNRIYGVDPDFNYSTSASFEAGFIQLNHSSAGVFRKENWVAFTKGFSNALWGTETYKKSNRYGRYQSYGALEILYPGDHADNGYNHDTWDWNHAPGTTVIRLPWTKLHAERERVDELQEKGFVGSLTFRKKHGNFLAENYGEFGLFAMDFQEREDLGFGTRHSPNNHNGSFTFKKSNFFFDDLIVCLASGISNNDMTHPTITTLFQRLDNNGQGVVVNGVNQNGSGEANFDGSSTNWLVSNYGTGFYLLPGNHSLNVKKSAQQNPNHDQIWPVDYSNNPTQTYYVGYIDHGANPVNESYEYILKPNASINHMQQLDAAINSGNKPYTVHQQDADAHILEHHAKGVFGYSVFSSIRNLTFNQIKSVNRSCLLMSQFDTLSGHLRLALTNPDLGLESRSFQPVATKVVEVVLDGEWSLLEAHPNMQILSSNSTETILQFTLTDGISSEILLGPKPVGTQDLDSSLVTVNVYPNPTKNLINISSSESILKAEVYDTSGRMVHGIGTPKMSNVNDRYLLQLHFDDLNPSVYFVKVETRLGIITRPVIVE